MTDAIAVAFVHGIGNPPREFANGMMERLRESAAREARARDVPEPRIEAEPVFWSPVVQDRQRELWGRIHAGASLGGAFGLREFLVSYASDVVAYQPGGGSTHVYDEIHAEFARALKALASRAGPAAPLVVIGHSLGSVIASNYLYDLQAEFGPYRQPGRGSPLPARVRAAIGPDPTPLERGDTLAQFYTMGSPLALWGVRAHDARPEFDYGAPVVVPAPALAEHHPEIAASDKAALWVNFYDKDDVIASPLRSLNKAHERQVKEDRLVNVGGLLESWNPLSHMGYWTDKDVTGPIGRNLAAAWAVMLPRRVPVVEPEAPARTVQP